MVKILDSFAYWLKGFIKKPFKVGLITPQYAGVEASNKGVAIHVYYLTRELAKLGCEVHVFCMGQKKSIKKFYIGNGKLVVHQISENMAEEIRDKVAKKKILRFAFDNEIVKEVLKENKEREFDIIHSHITFIGGLISRYINNIKWVHTIHSLEKHRLLFLTEQQKRYLELENWIESAVSYADAVITVSKKLKEDILKNYKIKKDRVFTIPNGVDLSLFNEKDVKDRTRRIIYVGRFSKEKGIDVAIRIAEIVLKKDTKLKFTIIAPPDYGELADALIKSTEKLGILEKKYSGRLEWIKEPLTRDELARMYKDSKILIQPSRYESFGMTVLEAMACGDAVISSNRGGLPEVVDKAGILVNLNIKAFVREILRFLKNNRLREKYGKKGVERAKNFDWEKVARQTLDVYRILSKREENTKEEEIAVGEAMKKIGEI